MSEFDTVRYTSFSCPSCGGRMVFDPGSQQLKCPYCGTLRVFQNTRETPNEYDIHYAPPQEDAAWGDETRVTRCAKCGAEFVLTGETKVGECPFCGSAAQTAAESGNGIAPESLVPFYLTRRQAQDQLRDWLKGRIFVTGALRKRAAEGKVTAVYLPHWTYIDEATSVYQGRAGRHYQTDLPYTVTDRDGKERTETRSEQLTRWETDIGRITERYDDVMIPGSGLLPEGMMNSILPYRMSRIVRYAPEYIAGYACVKPDRDVQEGWKTAQTKVDRRMAELAERKILSDADEAQVQQLETIHDKVRYKLVLLPLYLCTFSFRKKPRYVLINGENGRVGGQAPVSPLRVGIAVLLVLAVLLGLVGVFMARGGSEYMLYDFGRRVAAYL